MDTELMGRNRMNGRDGVSECRPEPSIRRIETLEAFSQWADGIAELLNIHQATLLDDFSGPDSAVLLQNTASYIPWLWLLADTKQVYALVCLDNITPGRHAWIHGVSHPAIRRHPGVDILAKTAIYTAFSPPLNVAKLKAEFEASNRGARGFCLRHGFTREARFARDNRIGGVWQDVLLYSLFRPEIETEAHGRQNLFS